MMAAKEIMECIKLKDKTYFLDKYTPVRDSASN